MDGVPDSKEKVRVVVADDHPLYREGVVRALTASGRVDVVAQSEDGRGALDQIREHSPDVALLDYKLPDLDGVSVVHAVTRDGLQTRVLLLSAFALTGCMVPKSDLEDAQAQNAQLQTQNQQLQTQNQQLTTQLADEHAQTCRLIGAIKYTVNSDLLFPSGSYKMSSAGQQIIGRLASQLAQFQEHHLVVEGYTDNQPVGAQLRRQGIDSNEVLSQRRADAVMEYLVSQGVKQDMVSAKGFGETNPVASNDTAQGRALNRRVELHLADTGCPAS